jgi:tRNA(fMet)-specific endonuclease VapC
VRRFLLDTGPLSAYLRGRPAALTLLGSWVGDLEAATSILCYGEVVEYLESLPNARRQRAQFRWLMRVIHPYPLSLDILDRYAELRRQMRPPHGPGLIGDIDTLIAATALDFDLTVITTDGDFQRVPGLDVRIVGPFR